MQVWILTDSLKHLETHSFIEVPTIFLDNFWDLNIFLEREDSVPVFECGQLYENQSFAYNLLWPNSL